jgi:hypothetical protein
MGSDGNSLSLPIWFKPVAKPICKEQFCSSGCLSTWVYESQLHKDYRTHITQYYSNQCLMRFCVNPLENDDRRYKLTCAIQETRQYNKQAIVWTRSYVPGRKECHACTCIHKLPIVQFPFLIYVHAHVWCIAWRESKWTTSLTTCATPDTLINIDHRKYNAESSQCSDAGAAIQHSAGPKNRIGPCPSIPPAPSPIESASSSSCRQMQNRQYQTSKRRSGRLLPWGRKRLGSLLRQVPHHAVWGAPPLQTNTKSILSPSPSAFCFHVWSPSPSYFSSLYSRLVFDLAKF